MLLQTDTVIQDGFEAFDVSFLRDSCDCTFWALTTRCRQLVGFTSQYAVLLSRVHCACIHRLLSSVLGAAAVTKSMSIRGPGLGFNPHTLLTHTHSPWHTRSDTSSARPKLPMSSD